MAAREGGGVIKKNERRTGQLGNKDGVDLPHAAMLSWRGRAANRVPERSGKKKGRKKRF